MSCSHPLGVRRGTDGRKDCRRCSPYIGTNNCRCREINPDDRLARRRQNNCHGRAGRLGQNGCDEADPNKNKQSGETLDIAKRGGPKRGGNAGEGVLEYGQSQEEEAEADEGVSETPNALSQRQQTQRNADSEDGQRECLDFEAKADKANKPAGHRRSDIGAKYHAQRLAKREYARVDEAYRRNGDRARRLNDRRHQRPAECAPQRTGRPVSQ